MRLTHAVAIASALFLASPVLALQAAAQSSPIEGTWVWNGYECHSAKNVMTLTLSAPDSAGNLTGSVDTQDHCGAHQNILVGQPGMTRATFSDGKFTLVLQSGTTFDAILANGHLSGMWSPAPAVGGGPQHAVFVKR
jgi:hypothetical protein